MTIILVAGPPLSVSALHCAGVGHWAFADDARLNAEHWAAAAEGKSGYRSTAPIVEPAPTEPAGAIERSERAAELIATIPDDLSIPPFLRRTVKS
jgi:hypothetical protein